MNVPKFCRIAVVVEDIDAFMADCSTLLGIEHIRPSLDAAYDSFTVMFGEHGLEPIQPHGEVAFTKDGRLIEVAIDVADAEKTREGLKAGGYEPATISYLPGPDKNEYLYGREFHGLPLMVCTAGDNEAQMRVQGPFAALDDAPLPKIGCVSVVVEDLDKTVADMKKYFGMTFVDTDPAGLGARAMVGPHRVKLVEKPSAAVAALEPPLAAIEFVYDDVEPVRARIEAAGHPVLHTRTFSNGDKAYFFGSLIQDMPVAIYPVSADSEVIGA